MSKYDVMLKFNLKTGIGELWHNDKFIININMSNVNGGFWLQCLQATVKYYQGDKDKCILQK